MMKNSNESRKKTTLSIHIHTAQNIAAILQSMLLQCYNNNNIAAIVFVALYGYQFPSINPAFTKKKKRKENHIRRIQYITNKTIRIFEK